MSDQGFSVTYKQWQDLNAALTESRREVERERESVMAAILDGNKARAENATLRQEVEGFARTRADLYNQILDRSREAEALRQEVERLKMEQADWTYAHGTCSRVERNQYDAAIAEDTTLRQENGRLLAVIARTCPSGHAMPPVYSFCPICAELERLRRQVEEQAGKLAEFKDQNERERGLREALNAWIAWWACAFMEPVKLRMPPPLDKSRAILNPTPPESEARP